MRPAGLRAGRVNATKGVVDICEALSNVPALRAAGLPKTFRTHDLRHAHASQLIDMGASPLAVKERLGHADILTTFRRYGHLFQGVQERLAADLDVAHREAAEKASGGQVVHLDERRPAVAGGAEAP